MNFYLSSWAWCACCVSLMLVPNVLYLEEYWQENPKQAFRESGLVEIAVADYPRLVGEDLEKEISAQAMYIVDMDSAVPLYRRNERMIVYPASATKLVTALTAKRLYESEKIFTVGDLEFYPALMGLKPGDQVSREALLAGLLIPSGNDAAYTLAENAEGGYEGFVSEMNKTIQDLNLRDTHLTNPSGLPDDEHVSTARDLAHLLRAVVIDGDFIDLMRTKQKVVRGAQGQRYLLKSTNSLLGELEGLLGGKTGYTLEAGEVLISIVERNERTVIIALLNSKDRAGETRILADWVFENFVWEEVILQ